MNIVKLFRPGKKLKIALIILAIILGGLFVINYNNTHYGPICKMFCPEDSNKTYLPAQGSCACPLETTQENIMAYKIWQSKNFISNYLAPIGFIGLFIYLAMVYALRNVEKI